jgi:pyruvate/2-oxoglutarate/acetoin dehydrogenase E1 component
MKTIRESVGRTGSLLVVEECQPAGGWGNEVIAGVAEASTDRLLYRRLGTAPTPIPYTTNLENFVIPSVDRIADSIREMVHEG